MTTSFDMLVSLATATNEQNVSKIDIMQNSQRLESTAPIKAPTRATNRIIVIISMINNYTLHYKN